MSDFITAITSLFTFLTNALFDIGDALVGSTIGQIILSISIFTLLVYTIAYFIRR